MRHIPRKRFGQHFLTDQGIIEGIVQAIAPRAGQAVVEIGPGLAALTQPLVERLGHLTVIELDRDLAQQLRAHPQLTVVESDVLKVDFRQLAERLQHGPVPSAGLPQAETAPKGLEPAAPNLLEQLRTGDRGEASGEPRSASPRELHAVSERRGSPAQQGPRDWLRQTAGAAAPSGGSAVHAVTSVGANERSAGPPQASSAPSGGSVVHEVTSVGALKLRVVGNLPYNISTPILFHLLDAVDVIEDQHFMLQKEVIDRMVAAPSTSDYGRLSVMLQWRYAMENVLFVPPQSFDPPPRVDSAVVRMVPHARPAALDVQLLSQLVQVAFSQRRKLLRHTLGQWLAARGFPGAFDVQRRAEEVPVAEYVALAQQVAAMAV